MAKYVAFLRGIMPMNPNMRNEKLRTVFEGLGLANVQTVITSGNVLFESTKNAKALETMIENALFDKLGIKSATIIRSKEELQALVDKKPFGKDEHGSKLYLTVTFLKTPSKPKLPPHPACRVAGTYEGAVCISRDLEGEGGPEFMFWLEKQMGKGITTRTWKTVNRILEKMED